ncbi:hypothetical protein DFH07DRAFT_974764 [Mycena maculata]|uniref:DUF6589 domain-containing protein n=1 Tax=Mycena maculata TaxID=230809 RepID=A0AAD7H653_9AGAR|nr:hypothetical protein DFH07DRAFT_974764 [Mycena maculata]
MRPVLQVWHTMWTDLCRIHETHWGTPLNDDPATLGNSAKKIGRPAPSNLKEVDYYPAADLLGLVHDTCMLNCWRIYFKCDDLHMYFTERVSTNTLPSFEELETGAKTLYDTYTLTVAQKEGARYVHDEKSSWAAHVPLGRPWVPLEIDPTSTSAAAPRKKKHKSRKAKTTSPPQAAVPSPPPLPFYGDQVISDTTGFMCNASISREVASAVVVGDVGCMWEGMKVMLINFAGSGHSRYLGYLLEMVCNLELESSPELQDATLDMMICNPSGKPGGSQACNIFQEQMKHELEPIIQHKDTDYGSDHVRNMWSHNLKDIYDIKAEMRQSVGLAKRSGRHKMLNFISVNLGAHIISLEKQRNNFTAGIKKLYTGGLLKWVKRTTMERGLLDKTEEQDSSSDSDDSEDDEDELEMTLGLIHAFDGEVEVYVEDNTEFPEALADKVDAE